MLFFVELGDQMSRWRRLKNVSHGEVYLPHFLLKYTPMINIEVKRLEDLCRWRGYKCAAWRLQGCSRKTLQSFGWTTTILWSEPPSCQSIQGTDLCLPSTQSQMTCTSHMVRYYFGTLWAPSSHPWPHSHVRPMLRRQRTRCVHETIFWANSLVLPGEPTHRHWRQLL